MIGIYFIIGLLASVLGALPLGASNIAVINTTIKQNTSQAFKIIIAAGIAEVFLSLYALHCATIVKMFVDNNIWIQFLIASILLIAGTFLLVKKKKKQTNTSKMKISNYALGFLLGTLNPPVLVYWIVAIGFINSQEYMLSLQSSYTILILFFSGIYIGKIWTLYLYSKFSHYLKHKNDNIALLMNKITGLLLIFIGLIQISKLYIL